MTEKFKVQIEVFEGPLEHLLDLIEKRKLFINDVSLAKVADDYIGYVKGRVDFPISDAAHFILVASTLLLIKSKSLLPGLELTEEESSDIKELERRLRMYKRVRTLKKYVTERFGIAITFPREESKFEKPVFTPDISISSEAVKSTALQIINSFPKIETLSKAVVKKVISLEDMIVRLTDRIQKNISMNFKEFATDSKEMNTSADETKANLIISFLAMLELVKQGSIAVKQSELFRDIKMEAQETAVPNYS